MNGWKMNVMAWSGILLLAPLLKGEEPVQQGTPPAAGEGCCCPQDMHSCPERCACQAPKQQADVLAVAAPGRAGPRAGRPGGGPPFGRGAGHGAGRDDQFEEDHQVFFYLLDQRAHIRRTVTNLPNGIETLTESDREDVAAKIQEHVAAMYERMDKGRPIHLRDPLFRQLFASAHKIDIQIKETDDGVLVRETSEDPQVAKLLQKHAQVVSLFIKNGPIEMRRNH